MIQHLCLAAVAILVLVRGPRAAASRDARLMWWSSAFGAVSLSTYGLPIPTATYDAFLGGQNLLTLIRDIGCVGAFWFFREALARHAGLTHRYGTPWGLAVGVTAFAAPFFTIGDRIPTDRDFIMNRLDQPAVWIYGTAYMVAMLWLLLTGFRLALLRWAGVIRLFGAGALLMAAGCVVEIGFLTSSHYGFGGKTFRRAAWNASEAPFFAGLALILIGLTWAALYLPLRRRALVLRLQRLGTRHRVLPAARCQALTTLTSDKQLATATHRTLVLLGNAERRGQFRPTVADRALMERAAVLVRPTLPARPAPKLQAA